MILKPKTQIRSSLSYQIEQVDDQYKVSIFYIDVLASETMVSNLSDCQQVIDEASEKVYWLWSWYAVHLTVIVNGIERRKIATVNKQPDESFEEAVNVNLFTQSGTQFTIERKWHLFDEVEILLD